MDTSIWVNHLRASSKELATALEDDRVLTHPFVLGELALSGLVNREEILLLLRALPQATQVSHSEALDVVQRWSLDGQGIGWVDTHLFAAALLSGAKLWTADKRLMAVCEQAGVAFSS